MPVEMRCTCGQIAFVCEITNNPRPENPTPCREHYLVIIKLRNELICAGVPKDENRE